MPSSHKTVAFADMPDELHLDMPADSLPECRMGIVHDCAISEGLHVRSPNSSVLREPQESWRTHSCGVQLVAAGMGVIEEVGASVRAVLARFTQGMKQGQRVVGAPWPSAEGEGARRLELKHAAAALHMILASCMASWPLSTLRLATS